MLKKEHRKLFFKNIKFKYKFSLFNENTLEEVMGFRISKLNVLSLLFVLFIILFFVAGSIIIFTPLRNYLPGYVNSDVRSQIVDNALRVDSLQDVINNQKLYIMNIQDIFKGNVSVDTVNTIDSLTLLRHDTLINRTEQEEIFRKEYEEREKYNLTRIVSLSDINGLIFYKPTNGLISAHFNPEKQHYGVDILANPNESILATMDGRVIVSTYTAEVGYLIAIQHNQNLVSVYKHCGSLLKKEGDEVVSGEAIALVGNKGSQSTVGPHLHFEMWYKRRPLNPEDYIIF